VAGSPYTISAVLSPAAALANYTVTYNTANFTINKRLASVTPNVASKTCGGISVHDFGGAEPGGCISQLHRYLQHGELHHQQAARVGDAECSVEDLWRDLRTRFRRC